MVSLDAMFWILIVVFAAIGLNRGWAKEVLVTFAVILSVFIITVLQAFEPQVMTALSMNNGLALFWVRAGLLIVLVFFAYHAPSITKLGAAKFIRERFQDALLGLFLGAINGYMVIGTLWYFMHVAQYPFVAFITAPAPESAAMQIIPLLPPNWLGVPVIYFAVAVAFAFVLVVFI